MSFLRKLSFWFDVRQKPGFGHECYAPLPFLGFEERYRTEGTFRSAKRGAEKDECDEKLENEPGLIFDRVRIQDENASRIAPESVGKDAPSYKFRYPSRACHISEVVSDESQDLLNDALPEKCDE